ncbi:MAG: hypothetical protein AB7G75_37685 [Candidatus Binatia bacterium]
MQTLAWLVVGLIQAECVKLTAWAPFVQERAQYAQSTQRRFRRWLANRRIEGAPLYGPLIQQVLRLGTQTLYLALDTSMLWNQYCLIRLSVVYRSRAVPVVWEVIEHGSSSVTHAAYEAQLDAVPALVAKQGENRVLSGSQFRRYGVNDTAAPRGLALSHSH